ncbi:hypothetical protein [Methylobacterium planeticum]|uniref:Uncharacterized protein n=1 Tax=Methylobacterium planeticum TaxID=2615211 RepID=A0A6N6MRV4_9HYPH|nr:hypothetical protein [Methylobacterium planeticum]KAB1074455.1 hypothetical protein F6X51_08840 [Methylobacterium planeticum]
MKSTFVTGILCIAFVGQITAAGAEAEPGKSSSDPRNGAAKLAGLVGFVNTSCPDLRSNQNLFKTAIERMGVNLDELERGELLLRARSYLEAYRKDVPASCTRAAELFGPNGTILPNIVLPK